MPSKCNHEVHAFDILAMDSDDLRDLPLSMGKASLTPASRFKPSPIRLRRLSRL
jgi:ATP-dependent DNA ligase